MNHQKTLETVYKHLIKQGKQSRNEYGSCLYRGPNNASCAVGCLIPDEHYDPYMDRIGGLSRIADRLPDNPFIKSLKEDDLEFLLKLQGIHDWSANRRSIDKMNSAFKLKFPDMDLSFLVTPGNWPLDSIDRR